MREALKVESLALSALWALAGTAAPVGFDVADTTLDPIQLDGGLHPLRHYKSLAVETRPEAKMAAAAVKLRKVQERLARSNFLPDLGIAVSIAVARTSAADPAMSTLYYQDGFNFSRVTAALALRWRFDFHNDAFDLMASRADLRAAEHQQDAAQLLLGRDVEEAYADLLEAQEDDRDPRSPPPRVLAAGGLAAAARHRRRRELHRAAPRAREVVQVALRARRGDRPAQCRRRAARPRRRDPAVGPLTPSFETLAFPRRQWS